MFTPAPATHGLSEFIAGKMTASADDRVLWQDVEQAQLIECPDQDASYFDAIMCIRRRRPIRHLHRLQN